jgi:NAD(P)-dependent dehydrogenase (short-subunit alcohol dehydrogenase family)
MAEVADRFSLGKGGSIVNISSMSVHQPTPRELPDAAAKAGLNTMTLGLATAFGPTVRVNAIQAGPFLTDISNAWDPEVFARFADYHLALGRAGNPEEIIGAAVFFASKASSYCTGSILRVDGGLH